MQGAGISRLTVVSPSHAAAWSRVPVPVRGSPCPRQGRQVAQRGVTAGELLRGVLPLRGVGFGEAPLRGVPVPRAEPRADEAPGVTLSLLPGASMGTPLRLSLAGSKETAREPAAGRGAAAVGALGAGAGAPKSHDAMRLGGGDAARRALIISRADWRPSLESEWIADSRTSPFVLPSGGRLRSSRGSDGRWL